jgi:hypothetical protein
MKRRIEVILDRHLDLDARQACMEDIERCRELTYRSLSKIIFGCFHTTAKEKFVFIKENNIHSYIDSLLENCPDAKYVFKVRDPRAFYASAKARKKWKLRNKFGSTLDALNVWRDDQLGGLRAMQLPGPERVYFQRYEDHVASPRTVLEGLCAFLGVRFSEAMLTFNTRRDVVASAAEGGPLENLKRPLMSDNFGKYKSTLSRTKVRIIEAELGGLIRRFGYDLDFPEAQATDHRYSMLARLFASFEHPFHGWRRDPHGRNSLPRKAGQSATPLPVPYRLQAPPGSMERDE